jgi:hypothetical protein
MPVARPVRDFQSTGLGPLLTAAAEAAIGGLGRHSNQTLVVCPMWPPEKSLAYLELPYSRQNKKIGDGGCGSSLPLPRVLEFSLLPAHLHEQLALVEA